MQLGKKKHRQWPLPGWSASSPATCRIEGKQNSPAGAALESGLEYRLPAMATPSDGNQTSYQAALPMQQRIKGKMGHATTEQVRKHAQAPEYTAKVKGDAGTYRVYGIDWMHHRILLDHAGLEWAPIEKVAFEPVPADAGSGGE